MHPFCVDLYQINRAPTALNGPRSVCAGIFDAADFVPIRFVSSIPSQSQRPFTGKPSAFIRACLESCSIECLVEMKKVLVVGLKDEEVVDRAI